MAKKSTKESDCGTSDSHTETSGGDVTPATKRNLAFLSGNKCANPECNVSLYTSDMTRSIGEAAHIAGEKPEAARYDQNMTNEERRHINNLIYLCANCHTQIDGDIEGERYSVTLLHEWKKKHEDKVFRLLDEGFVNLDFPELEEVVNWLLAQPVSESLFDDSSSGFDLIAIRTKIIKHSLSSKSQRIIAQACSQLRTVEEFINDRAKEDTTTPSFPVRLKAKILRQYWERVESNLHGDELFTYMCDYMSRTFDDYATKSASVSVLVYFFEKCDIFSE